MIGQSSQINSAESPQDDLKAHLEMVFGYCEGFAAVRLLGETGTADIQPRSLYPKVDCGLADTVHQLVQAAADERRGLYLVPCTVRAPGSAKAADIYQTSVVPVDLDSGDINAKRKHLERHLGSATMIVRSGGQTEAGQPKLHLYWKLTEACSGADLQKVATIRELLVDAVAADAAFKRLTQPIRVPGSIHGKNGVRTRVTILTAQGVEYELDDLLESARQMTRLPGLPPRTDRSKPGSEGPTVEALQKMRLRAGGHDEISRYDALSKVCGHWIRLARLGRASTEEALAAVIDHNQACIDPPWSNSKLSREFQALLELDQREYRDAWNRLKNINGELNLSSSEPPMASEDALASRFVADFGKNWRHVARWGTWLHWDGAKWTPDETQLVLHQIRSVIRAETDSLTLRNSQRLATSRTIRAVERMASSDPCIATRPTEWDAHASLLNSPSGVLNIDTGEILNHDPALMLTQSSRASSGGDCPTWIRFIDEITGGDASLAAYLARICGYCLTADTSEQVFFFFYGAGANGKSVFLQTISMALGSYAATAPLDSFMMGRGNSHPTDLAGLRGKRLVTVTETEPGRAWAESRIKAITGGDPIRARLLYRDFFEFVPTFKLVVAGNHRPHLMGVGEAMRRRLHLVPFDVTIPPERRDKWLAQRLARELDGILDWMIVGHRDWQKQGLAPPNRILDASQAYFADEDLTGQWIDETCDVGDNFSAPKRVLFESWSAWADTLGHEHGSQKSLSEALRERGFTEARSSRVRFFRGIAPHRGTREGET